jgi:uncharacterized glyoxalase superfamily protein PhnB
MEMNAMKIPPQYLPVMPYLIIRQTKAFLAFARDVFGATEQLIVHDEAGGIRHAEIRIGDAVIMFGGANEDWPEKTAGMFLYVEDVDKVYANAEDNGARILTPPSKQDYGYTAGFEDPHGNQWWIVQGEKE